jgi:zinc protease
MTISLQKPTVDRTVLDNGILLLVTENPAADIIAARIFIRGGSCYENPERSGLLHLLSATITKGCGKLSSLEIAETIESVGASLSTDATPDYFLLSLKTVSSDFAEIFELAGQILRSPTFPEAEVELERRLALQDIRSQQEQPFTIAFEQLREVMYQNHPYAMSGIGTEATMATIQRDDLVAFHQTYFRPNQIVISIAGRLTATEVVPLVEKVFGDWRSPDDSIPALVFPQIQSFPQQISKEQQTQQAIVMLGYLACGVHAPEYAALKLLCSYLGNGLSSRLFVELREKRGLAYDVSAFYPTRLDVATFGVYMGTAPENTELAISGLQTEVDLLRTEELTATGLQSAKNKILGQYALGKQTNSQIAQAYGWYEILGLGIDFDRQFQEQIAAVTVKEAKLAACLYLQVPYVSLVGPGSK